MNFENKFLTFNPWQNWDDGFWAMKSINSSSKELQLKSGWKEMDQWHSNLLLTMNYHEWTPRRTTSRRRYSHQNKLVMNSIVTVYGVAINGRSCSVESFGRFVKSDEKWILERVRFLGVSEVQCLVMCWLLLLFFIAAKWWGTLCQAKQVVTGFRRKCQGSVPRPQSSSLVLVLVCYVLTENARWGQGESFWQKLQTNANPVSMNVFCDRKIWWKWLVKLP